MAFSDIIPFGLIDLTFTPYEEKTAMSTATATIDRPQTGDKVEVKVAGTVNVSRYGDITLTTLDGKNVYLGGDVLPHARITVKNVAEPSAVGTLVGVEGTSNKWIRVTRSSGSEERWAYVDHYYSTSGPVMYTWKEILESAGNRAVTVYNPEPIRK